MKEENKYLSHLVKLILLPLILVVGLISFNNGGPIPNFSSWITSSSHLMAAKENIKLLKDDISPNSTDVDATILDEAHDAPRNVKLEKMATDLEKLEIGLQMARAAIKEPKHEYLTFHDPDFKPVGPLYWNANVFHRSYMEMEKRFKVYVYEEGDLPLFHIGPSRLQYATEGNFIHLMEMNDRFRTKNPDKAHVFFLPFSVSKMVSYLFQPGSRNLDFLTHTVSDYTNLISRKYPYWNRSLAADHFMLSCHDWGPIASTSDPYLKNNSIRVLCNANTSEGFQPRKDATLPEINLRATGDMEGLLGGPSPSNRSILAFFAGGAHGPVRPALIEQWGNKSDDDMEIHTYLPKNVSYYGMLRNSKYCLCPSGYEVANSRIVEAIYTGCVPVLICNNFVPPFSDVLNWKSFSLEVAVRDIPNLKTILLSISVSQHLEMYTRGLEVRKHFEVNFPPKRYDVFHMILHSVWLRRLNVYVHDQQQM